MPKTHGRVLPQLCPLKVPVADNLRGVNETDRDRWLTGNSSEGNVEQCRPRRVTRPVRAPEREKRIMSVFVLDQHHRPLDPCSEKRARLLRKRGRAVVHRIQPYTIRLKDRRVQESVVHPYMLKLDPGSKTTGVALAREEQTPSGVVHHAVFLAEIAHRGMQVQQRLHKRADYRRRRRSANLRYRSPRFLNRRRHKGWLPPSLESRVGNVLSWVRRLRSFCPVSRIVVERTKFDPHLLQNPAITNLEYQRGTLFGWELRAYVLATWNYQCAYCEANNVPLELDHVVPRSRRGSDRVSNLVACCRPCNERKGDQPLEQFLAGWPALLARIQQRRKTPLRDAAAMNATRYALVERVRATGLPVEASSGGRTSWNRKRFGIPKSHACDALCVGQTVGVHRGRMRTLLIAATGRGTYCRTNVDASGFPRGYLPRRKQIQGFQTGDLVEALVPEPLKTAGRHRGRVAVRTSGSFRVGKVDGIGWKSCRILQRVDGYDYRLQKKEAALPPQK
jgi:5-methylcytosine-specific restriction endonuclease McrA